MLSIHGYVSVGDVYHAIKHCAMRQSGGRSCVLAQSPAVFRTLRSLEAQLSTTMNITALYSAEHAYLNTARLHAGMPSAEGAEAHAASDSHIHHRYTAVHSFGRLM